MSKYDEMTLENPGTEMPDDPKPVSRCEMRARARAIREGRLKTPARDTLAAEAKAEAAAIVAEAEAIEAKPKRKAKAKKAKDSE